MSNSYEGLPAECWDVFGGNEPELDFWFLKERLKKVDGLCLDLACGSGKHLVPYLKEGIMIHGVDSSPTMIENCRNRLKNENLSTELYCQKMQELDLPERYETIFISVGSISVLTAFEDAMSTLIRCHHHLEWGGCLYVSLFMPEEANDKNHKVRQILGPKPFGSGSTIEIERWTESVDYLNQIVAQKRRYIVRNKGKAIRTEEYQSPMRWYGKQEFILMMEKAGFDEITLFGNFSNEPPVDWSSMIVVKGTKCQQAERTAKTVAHF